ncbi:ATP-binding protein [Actinacidiphila glaucinigra]|uniref:ATP-binding protein n=1 Tax=Actinacidiphila glaucinigra TaxID=235986 RepID=UPI0038682D0D
MLLLRAPVRDRDLEPPSLRIRFDQPKTLATAAVDRLLHHAHIVLTEGSSLRLTQAASGQGVVPLNQSG